MNDICTINHIVAVFGCLFVFVFLFFNLFVYLFVCYIIYPLRMYVVELV